MRVSDLRTLSIMSGPFPRSYFTISEHRVVDTYTTAQRQISQRLSRSLVVDWRGVESSHMPGTRVLKSPLKSR